MQLRPDDRCSRDRLDVGDASSARGHDEAAVGTGLFGVQSLRAARVDDPRVACEDFLLVDVAERPVVQTGRPKV